MHLSSWTSKLHERFARNFQRRSQLFPGPFGVPASPPSAQEEGCVCDSGLLSGPEHLSPCWPDHFHSELLASTSPDPPVTCADAVSFVEDLGGMHSSAEKNLDPQHVLMFYLLV